MADHKGIVLAGGQGTRFRPLTQAVNKHLFPVYDKPMIYFPLSTLMLMQIREILLITGPESLESFKALLGDGSQFGIQISYAVQGRPTGLPDALVIAEDFLNGSPCVLALGDNVFHGQGFGPVLRAGIDDSSGCTAYLYEVPNPESFGVVEFRPNGTIAGLEEKPSDPKSNWIVTGLYIFDEHAPQLAKSVLPSARGELEIVDLLKVYLEDGRLDAVQLERGIAWMDMGAPDSLLNASEYFRLLDRRQRKKVAVLEEIGWRNGWIDSEKLQKVASQYSNTEYGQYLSDLVKA